MNIVKKDLVQYPTYLNTLLEDNNREVYLCTYKVENPIVDICELSVCSTVEYIGNPLEFHLGENDDSVLPVTVKSKPWKNEENEHCPIPLHLARQTINEHNFQIFQKSGSICSDYPIYCICDMEDESKTLMLGSLHQNHKIVNTLVLYHGLYHINGEKYNVDHMRAIHNENVFDHNGNIVDKYQSYVTYDLTPLQEIKLLLQARDYNNGGNSIDNNSIYKIIFKIENIQEGSHYCSKWTDIKLLERLIKKLEHSEDNLAPKTNDLNLNQVRSNLKNAVKLLNDDYKAALSAIVETWDFVKQAQSIKEVQEYFDLLFLMLEFQTGLKSNMKECNVTVLSQIMHAKLQSVDSKMDSIPENVALYLLIEMGLEKLKVDYSTTISKFTKENFVMKDFSIPEIVRNINGSIKFLDTSESLLNLVNVARENLNKLVSLHILNEMCYCINYITLEGDIFPLNVIVQKYVMTEMDHQNLLKEPYKFEMDVDYNFQKICKGLNPIILSFKHISIWQDVNSVTTKFFKSKESIIPPKLLNDVSTCTEEDENHYLYHVIELREYVNFL